VLSAACLYIRFISFYKVFFSPRRNLRERDAGARLAMGAGKKTERERGQRVA